MSNNKYPNSGALFDAQNRVHPNSPDKSGDISVDKTHLQALMDETPEDFVKIKLSGWVKQSGKGEFLALKINTYKKPEVAPQAMHIPEPLDDSDIPF